MTIQRMDHVGLVVDDLDAAVAFFVALGMEARGGGEVGGALVDRIVGLDGVHCDFAFVATPDGDGRIELLRFHTPPTEGDAAQPANTRGYRHLAFAVDDLDATLARLRALGAELIGSVENYGDQYLLCYVRGPGGIIVELAEQLGG
jgi:catechol 2,3-dioxygenase-like lactoylglutathione lyase family enzyme